jgi:hypothetical protein
MSSNFLTLLFPGLFCLLAGVSVSGVLAEPVRQELLPAFVNLPFDRNIMPAEYVEAIKSPQSDLRKIAASLMERKRQFMERWENPGERSGADENFPGSFDDVEVVCLFPEEYLESLVKRGQLNVHQVGHSRGVCEQAIRAHAEDFFLGIHLENAYDAGKDCRLHFLRPKYGFLNFPKPCGIKSNPFRLLQYGQILIVYDDQVKLRTSYTYGDSLASYCEPWAITMHPLDPVPLAGLKPPGPHDNPYCRFVEAQIWGPLDLSDIREFRIPTARRDLLQALSSTGKPVFSYDRDRMEMVDAYVDVCDGGWKRGEPLNEEARRELKKEKAAALTSR